MHVRVLYLPGCPHADQAMDRVRLAAGGRADVTIDAVAVTDDATAERLGMHGSPTVQVDGADPFSPEDAPSSYACRYDPSGDPVPSVDELRGALGGDS